jgi:radical SAM-linked protein
MNRFRVEYKKLEPLRFTSVLDVQKMWERTFRRAGLRMAFTQGFHPSPRIHLGAPLPLGYISIFELMDVWLESEEKLEDILKFLRDTVPPGIEITNLILFALDTPVLQRSIILADYAVKPLIEIDHNELQSRIDGLLKRTSLVWIRRGKEFDLRSLISSLSILRENDEPSISMTLSAQEAKTGRPDEVMEAIGYKKDDFEYCRTGLYLEI